MSSGMWWWEWCGGMWWFSWGKALEPASRPLEAASDSRFSSGHFRSFEPQALIVLLPEPPPTLPRYYGGPEIVWSWILSDPNAEKWKWQSEWIGSEPPCNSPRRPPPSDQISSVIVTISFPFTARIPNRWRGNLIHGVHICSVVGDSRSRIWPIQWPICRSQYAKAFHWDQIWRCVRRKIANLYVWALLRTSLFLG